MFPTNAPAVERSRPEPAASALDLIGGTPLVRITRITAGLNQNIKVFAKLERGNPGGSVKDRPASRMIKDAEKAGLLTRDKVILDSSSGNTGIAYAMIGAVKGYRVRIVIPENASVERKKIMTGFGAELVFSSPFEGADGAIRMAKEIQERTIPHVIFSPTSTIILPIREAHELTTGPEIITGTRGQRDPFRRLRWNGRNHHGDRPGASRVPQGHQNTLRSSRRRHARHRRDEISRRRRHRAGVFDKSFPDERLTVEHRGGLRYDKTACKRGRPVRRYVIGSGIAAAIGVAAKSWTRERSSSCSPTAETDI